MEPQQIEVESVIAPLQKVTPLSKYLALSLFIILPFLGGYIGYNLAPEKIVIQEVSISSAKESNTSGTSEINVLAGSDTEVDTSLTEEEERNKPQKQFKVISTKD